MICRPPGIIARRLYCTAGFTAITPFCRKAFRASPSLRIEDFGVRTVGCRFLRVGRNYPSVLQTFHRGTIERQQAAALQSTSESCTGRGVAVRQLVARLIARQILSRRGGGYLAARRAWPCGHTEAEPGDLYSRSRARRHGDGRGVSPMMMERWDGPRRAH